MFVREHIDSVEQLEILLLLAAEPIRSWSSEEVAKELRTSGRSAVTRLDRLTKQGLLSKTGDQYLYQPKTEETREIVDALSNTYKTHRYRVISLIFSAKDSALDDFVDAFTIKRSD